MTELLIAVLSAYIAPPNARLALLPRQVQLLNSAEATSAKNKLPPLPETEVFMRNSVL